MSGTYVSVESGEIRVHPSFADVLACQRLGGRFSGADRGCIFPATEEHARLLRSKLRAIRATPEFGALLAPRQTPEELLPAQPTETSVVAPETDVVVPDGMLTSPWKHQKAAFKFCLDHFDQGLRGILLAMGMGTGKSLVACMLALALRARRVLIACARAAGGEDRPGGPLRRDRPRPPR